MRFIVVAFLALLAPHPVFAQSFGADTYRTGVFTGEGVTRPGLDCQGSTSRGRTCTGFLPSAVDGTLLDVTVEVPPGEGPHPLVAVLHGWGGSKTSEGFIAGPLRGDGHAVLRYSARGFGRSWGQVNLADIHVEIADLRSMIAQVVDHGRLHLDPDAVGVTGVSYGGGQSWLSLVEPAFTTPHGHTVRIRTVVPIVPWTDLLYSLIPNGRPENSLEPPGTAKLSYINALYVGGLRDTAERPYPNYPDYLIAWHGWINLQEPNLVDPLYRQIVDGIAGYRSIWWQEAFWRHAAQNRVPVFQIQGFTDDLFPLPEAKRMLDRLASFDPPYPIASYFGDIGHPRASNRTAERDFVVSKIREWFAFYLRGLGTEPAHVIHASITRPRGQGFDAAADVITVPTYAALSTGSVGKSFDGTALLTNPPADPLAGFMWDPLIMQAAHELRPLPPAPSSVVVPGSLAVFTVPVNELTAGAPLLIAGQPSVSLLASTAAPRVQLNVRLIDEAPDGTRHLITRGTFVIEKPVVPPDVPVTGVPVVIPTYGNLWQAAPGHILRLEISNVDSPYLSPSRMPSATTISAVRLDVPLR